MVVVCCLGVLDRAHRVCKGRGGSCGYSSDVCDAGPALMRLVGVFGHAEYLKQKTVVFYDEDGLNGSSSRVIKNG